jgi:hypothetical protein
MIDALKWIAIGIGALLLLLLLQYVHLAIVLGWSAEKTRGNAYYGLPPAGRARYRAALRRHARLLRPVLWLIGKTARFTYPQASIGHGDLTGPKGSCSADSFARAMAYAPRAEDVFIVTQMKCGTTWMQHIVYEVVMRGRGDIVDSGRTLYALAPWIEAETSVPIGEAPLHGAERPSRIIKTHLPADACPFSPEARYIYVARHPASCFASCADFIATNMGVMAPPLELTEQWFCSDSMWWGPWTAHVHGWWQRAQEHDNVLFLRFEDMKRDLRGTVIRVAEFLDVAPLTDAGLDEVVRKTGFAYMQEHQDAFEMNPPHLLQTDAEMFVSGTADRHRDVPADMRARIVEWSTADLRQRGLDVERIYPELTVPR